jgi:hypothetical protein
MIEAHGAPLRTHICPSLQNDLSIKPPVRRKVDCTMVSGARQFGVLFLSCDFIFDTNSRLAQYTGMDQHHRTIVSAAHF